MRYQRGVSLSGLLLWCVVIAMVALLVIKVGPEVMDYYTIKKVVNSTAAESNGKTVAQIRAAFDRYADVNYIKTLKGADLDITKDNNEVVISFSYDARIPLFWNVSLLIEFEGSSSGRD